MIERKVTEFEPQQLGKMNIDLSAVDGRLRHPEDRPSIGLISCPMKNHAIVESALRDTTKPIGGPGARLGRRCRPTSAIDTQAPSAWRRNSAMVTS